MNSYKYLWIPQALIFVIAIGILWSVSSFITNNLFTMAEEKNKEVVK